MGKIAFDSDAGGHPFMPGVFCSIVHRQGSSGLRQKTFESRDYRIHRVGGRFSGELGQHQQSGFSLHQGIEGDFAFSGDQAVAFPMADLFTRFYRFGSLFYTDTIRYLGFMGLSAEPFWLAFPMRPPESSDQLRALRRLGMINVLVDRFVADGEAGMCFRESAGDLSGARFIP